MAPSRKASRTEYIPVTEDQLKLIGGTIMGRDPEGRSQAVFLTRWLSFFGVDPAVAVIVWDMIEVPFIDDGDLSHAQPKHLLWALLFLRKYGDESEMAALVSEDGKAVDEKMFRKWTKIFVGHIAFLKCRVVSLLLPGVVVAVLLVSLIAVFGLFLQSDHLGEPEGRRHRK